MTSTTTTGGPADRRTPTPEQLRRATVGATIGSVVEWFDVAVYAYLATTIGAVFFSTTDSATALLSSFAVFGVAFVVRPLGGLFFGYLGDRLGRQQTLAWVILLVSGATMGIGLLPSYASIGVAAPVLLVVLRLLQGFSAGGEMGGASVFVTEYAPARRRGFYVSWVEMGCIAGFLLGSVVALVLNFTLTDAQLLSWGWRVPFLMAGPLGAVGLYIRTKLDETPEFEVLRAQGEVAQHPLVETLRFHWRAVLRTAGYALFQNATLYVILTFVPSFLSETLGYGGDLASLSAVITMSVICMLIPVMGLLSDRVGRRPVLAASCLLALVTAVPLFSLMDRGSGTLAIVAHVLLGAVLAVFLGVTLVAMNELFTTRVRYGGFSIGYNLSVSAFGGTAPFLVTLLIQWTGSNLAPAFYIMVAAAITLGVILATHETAPGRTGRLDPDEEGAQERRAGRASP